MKGFRKYMLLLVVFALASCTFLTSNTLLRNYGIDNITETENMKSPHPDSNANRHAITNGTDIKPKWRSTQLQNATRGGCINTYTGCRIAKWYYSLGNEEPDGNLRDCDVLPPSRKLNSSDQISQHDVIYVTFTALPSFVTMVLGMGNVTVDFVIISGQDQNVEPVQDETLRYLLDHKHVLHWFCQNLPKYGGANLYHPKLSPFPYGLKGHRESASAMLPPIFLMDVMEQSTNKTDSIYAGPLGVRHNPKRYNIPRETERISISKFLTNIAKAKYVLSPDGDRQDCYRHYEAIGLGTVPITELDPYLYRHLARAPVVYNNTDWNLTSLENKLDDVNPKVNRNLIWEEYWMDWVDGVVGVDLNWSDELQQ